MTSKLTSEQLAAITSHPGEPLPMQDTSGEVVGYLVTAKALDNLQVLRQKMANADASADVPEEEAHTRIRELAAAAKKKHA